MTEYSDRLQALLGGTAAPYLSRLFVTLRLAVRIAEGAFAVQQHHAVLLGAAALCALADLRLGRLTRGRFATQLPIRLAVDTTDVVLWTLALHGTADLPAIVMSPLAAEAALRLGLAAFVVIATAGTVAAVTLWLCGIPGAGLVYLWPMASVGVGVLAATYLRWQWRESETGAARWTDAAVVQAELSGQNSVAMGADSVIDLLARTEPLLRMYEPDPKRFALTEFKARLAERSSERATYLQIALLQYQRSRNERSPDLSADVEFRPRPGTGTMLLSAAQAQRLTRVLDELRLSGEIEVDTEAPGVAGAEQVIIIADWRVTLPADPGPGAHPVYPVPVAFAWGAMVTLPQSLPAWDGVPLTVTGPIALAMAATGWQINRRLARGLAVPPFAILAAAAILGAVQSVLTSWAMRPGADRLPFLFFLMWVGPLAGFYLRDLRPVQRVLVLGCGLVGAVGGALLAPVRLELAGLSLAMLWPVTGVFAVSTLRTVLDRHAADLREQLEGRHTLAIREGFRRGRELVIELTAAAMEDLKDRAAALSLSPREAREIARRIQEAGSILADLHPPSDRPGARAT